MDLHIPTPSLPVLTAAQMTEVDRITVEELGFDVLQIMETAGRAVASFARRLLGGDPREKRIVVLCGTGGNGGDGMVAARHFANWGADVEILLSKRPEHGPALHQLTILERLGFAIHEPGESGSLPPADLIVDALLGFSLAGAPRGETARLIEIANRHGALILAVDLPSGMDATSGESFEPCIHANATLTLGLPKTGLIASHARKLTGDLVVADIGIPAEAYRRVGTEVAPWFAVAQEISMET
jgi:NAD(P)H-hydrate epimerase